MAVLLARYLGPEDFGLLSYAASTIAIFAAAGHMGLNGLIVREIVRNEEREGEIVGTGLLLKFFGLLISYLILVSYALIFESGSAIAQSLIIFGGLSLLFKTFDVLDFWFQSKIKYRYVSISRTSSLVLSHGFRLFLLLNGMSLVFFGYAIAIQSLIAASLLILFYKIISGTGLSSLSFNKVRAVLLLKQGWAVYLGAIFAVIYFKIDQVMLRWLVGAKEVGIYSVAAQLSEAWYFFPVAIVSSVFPKLIKIRERSDVEFDKRFQQLLDVLYLIALVVAIVITIFSHKIVSLFFGMEYIDAANILTIHIWASIFIFLRAAFSRWILIENMLIFSLLTQGAGALINIVLNMILIPKFSGEGAALATLVSYATASFISLLVSSRTRPVFFMMLKTLCFVSLHSSWKKIR